MSTSGRLASSANVRSRTRNSGRAANELARVVVWSQRIEQLREQPGTRPDSADRLHAIYDFRYRRAAQRAGLLGDEEENLNERSLAWQRMVRDVLKTQRDELVRLRDAGSISDDVQHAVMRDLELEDQRLDLT